MSDAWEAAERAAGESEVSPEIGAALLRYFLREPSEYDEGRLHYGSDLDPDGCERKTWYRTHGQAKDPPRLGDQIRFHGGRVWEAAALDAIEAAGATVRRQVVVRPLRPSAWAWVGHADAVLVERRHLLEVKAPRSAYFARAGTDSRRLVRDSYRWQASAYLHELRRLGQVDTASFLFLDREGSHAPVEVPLTEDLVVPIDQVVGQEEHRSAVLFRQDAPPRRAGSLVVEVLKGRGKKPQRVVRATETRWALCSHCPYLGTCQPGPEEAEVTLPPGDPRALAALASAEEAWTRGEKQTPQVSRFDHGADVGPIYARPDGPAAPPFDRRAVFHGALEARKLNAPDHEATLPPSVSSPQQSPISPPAAAGSSSSVSWIEEAERMSAETFRELDERAAPHPSGDPALGRGWDPATDEF